MLGADVKKMSMKKVVRGGKMLVLLMAMLSRPLHIIASGILFGSSMSLVQWASVRQLKVQYR
jgi:hypothetical protein